MAHKKAHKKKSDVEETEDLLFSDVNVHKLKPKKEHEMPEEHEHKKPQEKHEPLLKNKPKKKAQKETSSDEHTDTPEHMADTKEIKINFHPKKLKKVGMVALFLFLAVSFFYNPFYDMFPWNEGISGNVVADTTEEGEEVSEETTETPEETEQTTTTETTPKETTDGLVEVEAKPLEPEEKQAGTITAEITGEKSEVKEWGGRVTEVSFAVENRKIAIVPKILVNIYDTKTMAAYRSRRIAAREVYQELGVNQRLKGTIDTNKFSFSKANFNREKTIQLQVWDEGETTHYNDDTLLVEVSKKFNFEG